jgi:cell wall-associated NlpC family hydrolase
MPGTEVAPGDEAPGDLIFWKGHVALVSAPGTIIHANAHHMASSWLRARLRPRTAPKAGGPACQASRVSVTPLTRTGTTQCPVLDRGCTAWAAAEGKGAPSSRIGIRLPGRSRHR